MNFLHDAYSAYLSGIATMDSDGFIHWDDHKIKILDAENEEYAIINKYGDQLWYKNGRHHREDGPAVVWSSGRQQWWENGRLYRIIWEDGMQQWI